MSTVDRDTKTNLLKAATELFARHGFAAVSVKSIADEAGVNISLVSYHFGGKEGLLRACVEPFVQSQLEFLDTKILHSKTIEDFRYRLRLFVESFIETHLKNENSSCIVGHIVDFEDPLFQEIVKHTMTPLFEKTKSFIESAQKAKFIRSDVDGESVVLLLVGGLIHALRVDHIRKKIFRQRESLHDAKTCAKLVNATVEMFFNGLERKK